MKKHFFVILFLLFSILLFSACAGSDPVQAPGSTHSDPDAQIAELMRQLDALRQSNQQQSQEYEALLEELRAAIDALASSPPASAPTTTDRPTDTDPSATVPGPGQFLYTTNGIYATITGFTGDDDSLVIPSHIDGYIVTSIGERAFSSSAVSQVTVSEGITRLDWFSFYGCTSLRSISLPSSISEIGYGSFDGCAKGLTITCPADSYALAYAQSYGISFLVK